MTNVKLGKRALALGLTFTMCLGMLNLTALAAESGHVHNEDGWICTEVGRTLKCELPEHTHTPDCYKDLVTKTLTCGMEEAEEHTHTDACYENRAGEPSCGQEETAGHVHDASCYGEAPLICAIPEGDGAHTHDDSCYTVETVTKYKTVTVEETTIVEDRDEDGNVTGSHEVVTTREEQVEDGTEEIRTLTCALAESAGHQHGSGCYGEPELICGLAEGDGAHFHDSSCYDGSDETEQVLICGKAEVTAEQAHIHGEDCYTSTTTQVLACGFAAEHTHDESCYQIQWDCQAPQPEVVYETKVKSVSIADCILTEGCLKANVDADSVIVNGDGTETTTDVLSVTYQWFQNGKAIDGATGPVLNAFANDGVNAEPVIVYGGVYTVEVTGTDNVKVASGNQYQGQYFDEVQNGSFENPSISHLNQYPDASIAAGACSDLTSYYAIVNAKQVEGNLNFYWKSSTEWVEVFTASSYSPDDPDANFHHFQSNPSIPKGNQAAELNATAAGMLYQDILTQPGSTIHWSLAHRGRLGEDTMSINVAKVLENGATEAMETLAQFTDGNSEWTWRARDYEVPEGQYVTRFYFEAVEAAGGNPSQGNLIDCVSFSRTPASAPSGVVTEEKLPWTVEYYVNGVLNASERGSGLAGSDIVPGKLDNYAGLQGPADADGNALDNLTLTLAKDGENALRLYFTKAVESDFVPYTVEWRVDGTNTLLKSEQRSAKKADGTVSVTAGDREASFGSLIFDAWNDGNLESAPLDEKGGTVLTLYYAKDAEGAQGTPDKYELAVTWKVHNGAWNDGTAEDVTRYVTLMKDGRPSEDGIAQVSAVPAGEQPNEGYKAPEAPASGWDKTLPATVSRNTSAAGRVFHYTYVLDDANLKELTYTVEYYQDGVLVPADTQTVTQTRQILDPSNAMTVDTSAINTVNKYVGYTCAGTSPSPIPATVDSGAVIRVYYEKTSYTLTIRYQFENGAEAAGTYTQTLNYQDVYGVDSPVVTGYTADQTRVAGTMPAADVELLVVYTPVPSTGGGDTGGGDTGGGDTDGGSDTGSGDPAVIPDTQVPLVEDPEIDLPDAQVPLEEIPEEEVPLEEIPEEEVPLDATPRTGDSSRTTLWASLSGISLAGLLALLGRKREDDEA